MAVFCDLPTSCRYPGRRSPFWRSHAAPLRGTTLRPTSFRTAPPSRDEHVMPPVLTVARAPVRRRASRCAGSCPIVSNVSGRFQKFPGVPVGHRVRSKPGIHHALPAAAGESPSKWRHDMLRRRTDDATDDAVLQAGVYAAHAPHGWMDAGSNWAGAFGFGRRLVLRFGVLLLLKSD